MNAYFLQRGDHQKWMCSHQTVGWAIPTHYTQKKISSRIRFSRALYCLVAEWWISSEILNSVCVFLSTNDWLALPPSSFVPSFLIVLMHSALSGSIRKPIFLADFRKSTIPSEPIIKLNITWERQERRKMKAVNKRRHAVSTYPFPLWKGD